MQKQKDQQRFVEKHIPFDEHIELRVLSTIIVDGASLEKIDFLTIEDFYATKHRAIFKAILDLREHKRSIHEIAVLDELQRNGDDKLFEDNPFYLQENIGEHVMLDPLDDALYLKKLSVCRSIAYGVAKPTQLAFDGEAEQAFEALEALTYRLKVNDQKSDPVPVRDMSTNFVENLTRLCDRKGQVTGVGTGFTDLDNLTGGLQKSDLIILAARPAIGKTSMALSIARNASSKYGHGIAIFSLEMSREQLYQRLIAMEAGIDQQRLRTGWIDDEDWENIVGAIERINNMNIYIDDSANITPDEIRNKVRRLVTSGVNIGLIIIDYMQLMSLLGKNGGRSENRVQEVSEISRKLKGVARDLDMPVMALSQLSRAVESRQSKIPQLSDLRESGSIEQDSDLVFLLYRDDVYNPETERPNIADLIVAKHRNGPVGTVSLYFQKSQTKFENLYIAPLVEA